MNGNNTMNRGQFISAVGVASMASSSLSAAAQGNSAPRRLTRAAWDLCKILCCALTMHLMVCAPLAFGQGSTSGELHGTVRDPSGALIPSATVKAKDIATGIEKTATSAADGAFVLLNLQAGAYQVTVTSVGFQTGVYDSVIIQTGRVTDLPVGLKIGAVTQAVEVNGGAAAMLETTSQQVSTTVTSNFIQDLPFSDRNTLPFALLSAGVQTPMALDNSGRTSTFNGLPNASMNISVDGINNNSQRFKTGGTSFFEFAPSRLDAVDEIQVATAGFGADAGGEGAMQVRFTTKRGTETYHGKIFEQFQNEALNANTWFKNLQGQPISRVRNNNFGGSFGGRLVPFLPYFRDKLFFFANLEYFPQPGSATLSTTVLTAASQAGNFTYNGTDSRQHTVNLLQAVGGTADPTIAGILGQITSSQQQATGSAPISGKLFDQTMFWTQPTNTATTFPTARVDYQISNNIAWHGTWNLRHQNLEGSAPPYPGSPYTWTNGYKITTYVATNAVDWTITPHVLNSFVFGVQSNGEYFYQGSDPHQWAPQGNRLIVFPASQGATTPFISNVIPTSGSITPFIRNNPVYNLTDNLNWVKGRHRVTIGGTFLHTSFYETSYGSAGLPNYRLGVATGDPVATAIQNALPAINTSNGDLTDAQNLYAILTGRLSSLSATANVDEHTRQYAQFAPVTQRFAFSTGALYVQDSFRWSPGLTLNYGLRWELDGAIHNTNGIDTQPAPGSWLGPSTAFFAPGNLGGNSNPAFQLTAYPYRRDFRNPSPNVGLAWNPSSRDGRLGKLLGDHKTVIRASYSLNHFNEGLNAISNRLSSNPGATQSGTMNASTAASPTTFAYGLSLSSASIPAIPLSPASFTSTLPEANYSFSSGSDYINPGLRSPYVQNWNIGVQRELGRSVVLEARYVGNHSIHLWHQYNAQETNIFENGFLTQFIQANTNLTINQANGKGNTLINNGLPGQAPIPIFETAFGARGGQGALAPSSGFSNGTFVTNLQQGVAGTLANTLATNSQYYCRLVGNNFLPCAALGYNAPGPYPINFFQPNPFVTSLQFLDDNASSNYNGLQVEVRRRVGALQATANYTWSHTLGNLYNSSNQSGLTQTHTLRNGRLDYGPTPFDIRQVFQAYFTYDLPFGKGRRFAGNSGVLDRMVGGWLVGGLVRRTTGAVSQVTSGRNTFNSFTTGTASGVVLLGGLTAQQLQADLNSISGYNAAGKDLITNTSIIGANGQANPQYLSPASTPGVFGSFLYLYGPSFFQIDASLTKEIPIRERLKFAFQVEALNLANHPVFTIGTTNPTSSQFGQVCTSATQCTITNPRNVQLRAYVSW